MNNGQQDSPASRIGNKIRFSIVLKLNIKLFLRQLSTFLVLDIILILLCTAGLVTHAEQIAANTATVVFETEAPAQYDTKLLKVTGCEVTTTAQAPKGFKIPNFLQKHALQETAQGIRRIDFPTKKGLNFWEYLEDACYQVAVEHGGSYTVFSMQNGAGIRLFLICFTVLLVWELLSLFSGMLWRSRTIRRTLRPIEELSETAQALNSSASFTPEELEALAGKLDGINATRLDTRISVGETQTELKTLASAINGMLDRINESYRSQVRFVSDASHELRTPIAVIQGYANLLDRWGKNDEKTLQESIDAIKEETSNMKNLVEKLLFLARGDNNTMVLQIENFELSELVKEVFKETQMIDSGHEYALHTISVFVNADQSLIKQALRILIDNAIKYTPAGKKITISLTQEGTYARLFVQDEGIGIPDEAVPRIFDRFYRADESRARATGGTGLGLSIAKWIAERHGGHMEVLSREDIGSRISILLPASMQTPALHPQT
jgi:two-component system sensor histidine kinase ArlS